MRLTERIVFDDKTENEVCENAANSKDEDTSTPTVERRNIFFRWQSNDRFFVLVDSVSMMLYGITDVRVPLVNIHRVSHYGYCHAIVQEDTIVVVNITYHNTIIARSGDGWSDCFAGRAEEQET